MKEKEGKKRNKSSTKWKRESVCVKQMRRGERDRSFFVSSLTL